MAAPCTPSGSEIRSVRAETPDALKAKCTSPGDKTRPFGTSGPDFGAVVEDPIVPVVTTLVTGLHSACSDMSWADVYCCDAALRVLYDYSAVYGTLGCTSDSMASAVYEVIKTVV